MQLRIVAALAASLLASAGWAHEGHDPDKGKGNKPPPLAVSLRPRMRLISVMMVSPTDFHASASVWAVWGAEVSGVPAACNCPAKLKPLLRQASVQKFY